MKTCSSMTWSTRSVLCLVAVWCCPGPCGIRAADDLDRQLLESLEGRREPDSPATVVHRLLENTESARRRLAAGQLDEQTASIQQQILDDIDALLEQTGSAPPSGSPSPPPAEGSPSQPSGSEQTSQAQESQAAPGDSATEPGIRSDDPNTASRESAERTTAGQESAEMRERRLGLATAAWGHLPPKVREQMRSAFSETYLPKYDELVRRYYEALAARREGQRTSTPPPTP